MLQIVDNIFESTGKRFGDRHGSTLFQFFLGRSPIGSAGRRRPPLLPGVVPGQGLFRKFGIPPSPVAVPPSIPKTTKLQPENAKQAEVDPGPGTTGVPQQPMEENEVEGPPLSSKIAPAEAPPSQDIAITLVPVTAVCVLVVGLGMGAWSLRNKFCRNRKSKEDTVWKHVL